MPPFHWFHKAHIDTVYAPQTAPELHTPNTLQGGKSYLCGDRCDGPMHLRDECDAPDLWPQIHRAPNV